MKTTIKWSNRKRIAPRWFRRLKRVISTIADTAAIILISKGALENAPTIVYLRAGVGGLMNILDVFMSDEDNEPQEGG